MKDFLVDFPRVIKYLFVCMHLSLFSDELQDTYGDVDGSRETSCADPGVDLTQLPLLLLCEARLVFLHVPQGLAILAQHRFYVPVVHTQRKDGHRLHTRLLKSKILNFIFAFLDSNFKPQPGFNTSLSS